MTDCPGCVAKDARLKSAVELLRRGVNAMRRVGWEPGETDAEWTMSAAVFIGDYDQESEYLMRKFTDPPEGVNPK